jgi:hypothetical protein
LSSETPIRNISSATVKKLAEQRWLELIYRGTAHTKPGWIIDKKKSRIVVAAVATMPVFSGSPAEACRNPVTIFRRQWMGGRSSHCFRKLLNGFLVLSVLFQLFT